MSRLAACAGALALTCAWSSGAAADHNSCHSALQKYAWDEAIERCTVLIETTEDARERAVAYASRGAARGGRREFDLAFQDLERALTIDPVSARVYVYRGIVRGMQGAYDDAIADHSRALRLDPNESRAYSGRAWAYGAKGLYDLAVGDYSEQIRLDPDDGDAYSNRCGMYYRKGDNPRALEDCSRGISLRPDSAVIYSNRAAVYLGARQYDLALADAEQALRLDASHANAYYQRGVAQFRLRQYAAAVVSQTKFLESSPTDADGVWFRAMAHMGMADLPSAITDFVQSYRLAPSDLTAAFYAGHALYAAGRYDEAADASHRVLLRLPAFARSMLLEYLAAKRLGSPDAEAALRNGLRMVPLAEWPAPAILMFLGARTPDQIVALDLTDNLTAASPVVGAAAQSCETAFYVGEWYALREQREPAMRELTRALSLCGDDALYIRMAAEGELARLAR